MSKTMQAVLRQVFGFDESIGGGAKIKSPPMRMPVVKGSREWSVCQQLEAIRVVRLTQREDLTGPGHAQIWYAEAAVKPEPEEPDPTPLWFTHKGVSVHRMFKDGDPSSIPLTFWFAIGDDLASIDVRDLEVSKGIGTVFHGEESAIEAALKAAIDAGELQAS